MKFLKVLGQLTIILFLTALTQIGGLLYFLCFVFFRQKGKRLVVFSALYLLCTLLLVPFIAPFFGREKIRNSEIIEAQSVFYILANRNYVRPALNDALEEIALDFTENHYYGLRIVYLDANFPFINGFPLLPHLSHNDGKKLDISLIYKDENGEISSEKPSMSGYGVFEGPTSSEYNQVKKCLARGNWQYDIQKYVTFGTINPELQFSEAGTKTLLQLMIKNPAVGKVFIEPHLKHRMGLSNSKIRFHGCQAVRHDDHIHLQLK